MFIEGGLSAEGEGWMARLNQRGDDRPRYLEKINLADNRIMGLVPSAVDERTG